MATKSGWEAKLVDCESSEKFKLAGELRGGELGIDVNGTIWECMVMSDLGHGATRFGAKNVGYPCYYHEDGCGPRVRVLKNPIVTIREEN